MKACIVTSIQVLDNWFMPLKNLQIYHVYHIDRSADFFSSDTRWWSRTHMWKCMHTLYFKDRTRIERITILIWLSVWTEDSACLLAWLTDWLIKTWSIYFTMMMISQQNHDSSTCVISHMRMHGNWRDWIECTINLVNFINYQRAADLTPSCSPLLHRFTWELPYLVNSRWAGPIAQIPSG